ncbi:MAG: glycosyltransferase family 2 protein [Propionibacteriaceae bacterium]|nr:glycosyltransferase family 2 protein [Propionibacteriaceae bacterium]
MPELSPLPANPGVSYVMPVLNEARYLEDAVAAVLGQDYPGPAELVIALATSDDGTDEIAAALAAADSRVKIVQNTGHTIPAGLNAAIAASQYPVVIRVDAHSELPDGYTATMVAALARTGAANVGGTMRAQGRTPFQQAVARAYNSPFGLGGGAYHLEAEGEQDSDSAYLGVFRREVLEEVGGYDETLLRAEDWELNSRIRAAGYRVVQVPGVQVVYWPRATWTALRKQMYATGVWRGALVRRQGGTPWRYLPPPLVVVMLGSCIFLWLARRVGLFQNALCAATSKALQLAGWGYFLGVAGVAATRMPSENWADKGLNWLALATMHLSWGTGFIKGWLAGAQPDSDVDRSRIG